VREDFETVELLAAAVCVPAGVINCFLGLHDFVNHPVPMKYLLWVVFFRIRDAKKGKTVHRWKGLTVVLHRIVEYQPVQADRRVRPMVGLHLCVCGARAVRRTRAVRGAVRVRVVRVWVWCIVYLDVALQLQTLCVVCDAEAFVLQGNDGLELVVLALLLPPSKEHSPRHEPKRLLHNSICLMIKIKWFASIKLT
jgi:hypothetical protein